MRYREVGDFNIKPENKVGLISWLEPELKYRGLGGKMCDYK